MKIMGKIGWRVRLALGLGAAHLLSACLYLIVFVFYPALWVIKRLERLRK